VLPPLLRQKGTLRFHLPADLWPALRGLPWRDSLERWDARGVRFLDIRSGLSRHVVRFVETRNLRVAIKQTSGSAAARECTTYTQLHSLGVPTLEPVGIVLRDDGLAPALTPAGIQTERHDAGFLITRLMDNVIPDAFLFRRAFRRENRRRIWDAVIHLFVRLHARGVYWGDASLANMLIHFATNSVPELGFRTTLRAILADAETVELHPSLSATRRMADLEFFLESMAWTEADLKASGIVREPVLTAEDEGYFAERYRMRFDLEQEKQTFGLVTRIDVDSLLGDFDLKGQGDILLNHIQEHRWYLGERTGGEVSLERAAEDWYRTIFKPVCKVFSEKGLTELFPESTASALYLRIMEHKYYMSQRLGTDVGLLAALQDYMHNFAPQPPGERTLGAVIQSVLEMFRGGPADARHPQLR
jgi:hypothetical protein